jgi:hypothetical protein
LIPLAPGAVVATASDNVRPGSSVGIHEISGAVVKINAGEINATPTNAVAANERQAAAGTAVSGRVTGVAADPFDADMNGQGVSTAGGGAWKSRDGGATWAVIGEPGSGGHVEAGAVLPSVTDMVLETYGSGGATEMLPSPAGTGILRSMDSGRTFGRDANAGDTITSNPSPTASSDQPLPVLLVIANRDFYLVSRGDAAADHVVCKAEPNGDILCIIFFD